MLVIGLTGGIAAGKTTVAELFAAKGVPIIDTDIIARDIVQPGQIAYQKILETFGNTILLPNGALNRQKLKEIIFTDPEKKLCLERLMHPLIRNIVREEILKVTTAYCIVVIPLLVENRERIDYIDRILVVDAPEDVQRKRLLKRDRLSDLFARQILSQQALREMRLIIADDVIENIESKKTLSHQIDVLHEKYMKEA